jgi:hypothetical protein
MATKPSILTKIAEEKRQADVKNMSIDSFRWLQKKMNQLRSSVALTQPIVRERNRYVRPLLSTANPRQNPQRNKFLIGGMYFFLYDPLGKRDLPYYDRFPLVIPLQMEAGGFLGLNIHYLPMKYRIYFMRKLMARAIYDEDDEPYRFRITYEILDMSKKLKEFRPCVKRYLFSHMKSRIIQVQPEEWDVAISLPVHQFKKTTPATVWEESMDQVRN